MKTLIIALLTLAATAAQAATVTVTFEYDTASYSEVTGFNLYHDGQFLCDTSDTQLLSMNCPIVPTPGINVFTLTAIATYSDGTIEESTHSEPIPAKRGFGVPQNGKAVISK